MKLYKSIFTITAFLKVFAFAYEDISILPVETNVTDGTSSKKSILLHENGSLSKGKWQYYDVKDASEIRLYNLSSDLDLYVKTGSKPSFNNYDCRPYKGNNIDEICKVSSSKRVYIGIYGYESSNFSLLVTGKSKIHDTNDRVLDDILNIVSLIETNNTKNNTKEFLKIINWIDEVSMKVKTITNRDYTQIPKEYKNTNIYSLKNNIFSNNRELRIDDEGDITSIDNGFLLIKDDCKISFASNSVIFCTGDIDISHSNNNIIISNGNIEISHDGGGLDSIGSMLYTKNNIDIAHSTSSIFLFSKDIEISHIKKSDCLNTGRFNASFGSCNLIIDDRLKERYEN